MKLSMLLATALLLGCFPIVAEARDILGNERLATITAAGTVPQLVTAVCRTVGCTVNGPRATYQIIDNVLVVSVGGVVVRRFPIVSR